VLDVDKLLALRAVAASVSISAAARELGYTRSAVPQQILSLERAAKTAVLRRGGNKVVVTAAGRILLEHTERVLAEARAAEAAVRIGDGRVVGELRAGVPFREGPPLMSSALTGVRRRHRNCRAWPAHRRPLRVRGLRAVDRPGRDKRGLRRSRPARITGLS
jgi:DNA-binding transcriptional LysR family regulator